MYVVTVARKPLSKPTVAANVLTHGSGALNVGDSRVTGGRWPTNLVLQHRPGCRRDGTERVRTSVNHHVSQVRFAGAHGTYGTGAGGVGHDYADADGMEEVAAWACDPECPVPGVGDTGRFFKQL